MGGEGRGCLLWGGGCAGSSTAVPSRRPQCPISQMRTLRLCVQGERAWSSEVSDRQARNPQVKPGVRASKAPPPRPPVTTLTTGKTPDKAKGALPSPRQEPPLVVLAHEPESTFPRKSDRPPGRAEDGRATAAPAGPAACVPDRAVPGPSPRLVPRDGPWRSLGQIRYARSRLRAPRGAPPRGPTWAPRPAPGAPPPAAPPRPPAVPRTPTPLDPRGAGDAPAPRAGGARRSLGTCAGGGRVPHPQVEPT